MTDDRRPAAPRRACPSRAARRRSGSRRNSAPRSAQAPGTPSLRARSRLRMVGDTAGTPTRPEPRHRPPVRNAQRAALRGADDLITVSSGSLPGIDLRLIHLVAERLGIDAEPLANPGDRPTRVPCLRPQLEDHLRCPFPQLIGIWLPGYHEPPTFPEVTASKKSGGFHVSDRSVPPLSRQDA